MRAITTAILLLLTLASSTALAYEYMDCSGNRCTWGAFPVPYYINYKGTQDTQGEKSAIIAAFDRWDKHHQYFCTLSFDYKGVTSTANFHGADRDNVIFFKEKKWEYGESALALTVCTYYTDSGMLIDCDIGFNGQDYEWTVDRYENGKVSIRDVLTHEIGHFWGLDHSDDISATMYPYYKINYLTADLDYDDINAGYHLFCSGSLHSDDELEPNDSLLNAHQIRADKEYENLYLYDHDVFKAIVSDGDVLGVSISDNSPNRIKGLRFYTGNRLIQDERTCTGDCTAYFGEIEGDTTVYIKVYGAFDEYNIENATYSLRLLSHADESNDNAMQGSPFDIEDDIDYAGDDDDYEYPPEDLDEEPPPCSDI